MDRLFFETKASNADTGEITATAWVYDTPDRVGDVIEKGAFAGVKLPLPMLFGHDLNDPIGIWSEVIETKKGIEIKGKLLIDTVARAREVLSLVVSGAVTGTSVGFRSKKSIPLPKGGRKILSGELMEISLVTIPCHPGARVTSAKSAVQALRIAEAINRASAALSQKR